jgi:hypothetical protein
MSLSSRLVAAERLFDGSEVSLEAFPELRIAVSNAHSAFDLVVPADFRFRIGVNNYTSPSEYSLSHDQISLSLLIKDQFIRYASDTRASREMWAREKSLPAVKAAVSDVKTMEAKARTYATRLGIQLDQNYRYWEGPRGVYPGNYDVKRQAWGFLWHRYYGGVPVWNDYLTVTLDDVTGKLLSFASMVRAYRYERELKPVITLEEARAKAIKYYVASHSGIGYDNLKQAKMGTYEKTMSFYYMQEELRPENLKLLKNPKDDQKLRLCHGIYVSCWFKGEEDKPMRVLDLVMVDAVTGEEVVRNAID